MCIYNKLAQSPSFKNLFIDTFGESEDLNVKFEIIDIPIPNGQSSPPNGNSHVTNSTIENGEVTSADVTINIDMNYMNTAGSFFIAQTIMHESIHSYLQLKMLNCNLGTTFSELNNTSLGSLLGMYFDNCQVNQADHEFMFDEMIPTMSDILDEIKDYLITQSEQQAAESQSTFLNENTPNGLPYQSWSWDQFYYYINLRGLQVTNGFINEITGHKATNFFDYKTYANTNFNSPCND